ncbi:MULTISPECIES: glycosyltransferase [unclassified Leptolyngbya]|uniref:glycosyltransferase family 2 protein n=1 Tax=unclassified Leptolyngbya TaxID=2650499 RepID=UPI0016882536|nr:MULTISPECIES: glycosyltransferase [unclassified Leptolyngbya]MBD1910727.1 glycosyltransferase [Leptolyngbya sp. FACHB-8]MBD2158162.1 glycosyltransferase [Leptolyngbya sp. FACHB-16]
MGEPLVSIVINNYNYGQFIGEAINSALSQNYPHVEVIVVDDESSDNSIDVIKSYGDRIISVLKQNGGQGSALNAGFQASKGDIIFFLDADDYFYPTTVEQVVANWQPDTAQCQYRLSIVDAKGTFIEFYPVMEIPFDSGDVWKLLLNQGRYRTSVTSGTCFSRAALQKVMPIPEMDFRISADGYLVATVPFFGQVTSLDISLGARRVHDSNLWASQSGDWVNKLRKNLLHDKLRYQYIDQVSVQSGHEPIAEPGMRDYVHLTNRIASRVLEPDQHPFPEDSRLALAWRGVMSLWQRSRLPQKRKVVLSAWFLWVGIMPNFLARPAIAWLVAGQSRPKFVDAILKKVRALSR